MQRVWIVLLTTLVVGDVPGLMVEREKFICDAPTDDAEFLKTNYGWPAGTIQEQLDRDKNVVPFGKGAIFVPSMKERLDEPPIAIYLTSGQKVAEATTGVRVVLSPGDYKVQIGSGSLEQRQSVELTVREGFTTIAPPTWSGLTIHTIDAQLNTFRGSYELIRMKDRQYLGIGFGGEEQAGEPVNTWVLQPGLYKVVQVGETYRARRNFSTVRLSEGRHTHFNLIIDRTTNDFLGAGEATEGELFVARSEALWASIVVGGDLSLSSRKNALGGADGDFFSFRAFADGKLSYQIAGNPLLLQLQIEEGQTKAPKVPWQTTQDRADIDALYVYRLLPWLGPYARVGVETNLLQNKEPFTKPTDVLILNKENTIIRRREDLNGIVNLPTIGLIQIKEGAGFNVRVLKAVFGEATVRTGFGGRHSLSRGRLDADDDSSTPELEYRLVDSTHLYGIEATLLLVARFTRWVLLQAEIDSLFPFKYEDKFSQAIVLEAKGQLALKLTEYFSINYVLRFLRNRQISADDVRQQDVLLRFSVALP